MKIKIRKKLNKSVSFKKLLRNNRFYWKTIRERKIN